MYIKNDYILNITNYTIYKIITMPYYDNNMIITTILYTYKHNIYNTNTIAGTINDRFNSRHETFIYNLNKNKDLLNRLI